MKREESGDRDEILNVHEEMRRRRSAIGAIVDRATRGLATPTFFLVFLSLHTGWVVANLGVVPGVPIWDRPPFMLLATITSALAPLLTLLVLLGQRRGARVDEVRQEIELQVQLHVEREVALALRLLDAIRGRLDVEIDLDRDELERSKEPMDPDRLLERMRRRFDREEGKVE